MSYYSNMLTSLTLVPIFFLFFPDHYRSPKQNQQLYNSCTPHRRFSGMNRGQGRETNDVLPPLHRLMHSSVPLPRVYSQFTTASELIWIFFFGRELLLWAGFLSSVVGYILFLAIFRNKITTIVTPSTSEGGGGGGHVTFFVLGVSYYESAMFIYIYAWLSLATPQIYTGVSSSTPN